MKPLIILSAALMLAVPALALAENQPAPKTAVKASKPAAKPKSKSKNKSKPTAKSKSDLSSRDELRSKASQAAAGVRAAERALSPEELALAGRVQTGRIPCELGNEVVLAADPKAPGHFDLEVKKTHFRMTPVHTSTGAIRLEDEAAGAVWLQLANKSMLMNQKLGQRLADDCQSPEQTTVAEGMKRTPPPSLLDGVPAGSIETVAPKR